MYKAVITGGPHSGKTTLLEALRVHPDVKNACFIPEAATEVINDERQREAAYGLYAPKFPWLDYAGFAPLVLDKTLALEAAVPRETAVVFQDRSLVDTLGYLSFHGMNELVPETRERIREARYDVAFFCGYVGTFTQTAERRDDPEQLDRLEATLLEEYIASEVPIVTVPRVGVAERVALVLDTIQNLGV